MSSSHATKHAVSEVLLKQISSIAAVVLLTVGSASAFDHARRGFVLGAGIGYSPSASWKADPYYLPDNSGHNGVAAHVLVGGARDKRNMLVGELAAVWYSSPTNLTSTQSVSVMQWHLAAAWYHYYGRTGKSLFTAFGFGPYFLTPNWSELTEFGGAVLLGGGYEFARHMQIGAYYSAGREFSLGGSGNGCGHLSVLLTVVEY